MCTIFDMLLLLPLFCSFFFHSIVTLTRGARQRRSHLNAVKKAMPKGLS